MKESLIIIFNLLITFLTQAQDYQISFVGSGGSTTIDSVQVKNLTQNTGLTLDGTDVLHLMGIVGIDQAVAHGNAGLCIYPNPMNETSFAEFEATTMGTATIELCDITGKQVAETQIMLPLGKHTFTVSGLSSGIYTLSIQSVANVYSGKIVCTGIVRGNPKISYLSGRIKSAAESRLKSAQTLVPMQYNDGDQLLFKCFSGIYSTVIPLVPAQSQTVTVNFVACTDEDNHNYATVTIGTQIWMAENLNVGIMIDGVQGQTDNGMVEKYCYYNNVNYCSIYGGLYQWNEMMQYTNIPGYQGICPAGWHIPTKEEWITETDFLGGSDAAGGKMKSTGTIESGTGLWYSPNTGATNESGFTAFPAGELNSVDFTFYSIGLDSRWWCSTYSSDNYAWYWALYDSYVNIGMFYGPRDNGWSVRCLRD